MNEVKKCVNCDYSEIYEDGIYCTSLKRWVGRSSETSCVEKNVKNECED